MLSAGCGADSQPSPEIKDALVCYRAWIFSQHPFRKTFGMINRKKVVVVMPAYNAAKTLASTYKEIQKEIVDEILLVDDASVDDTVKLSNNLGIKTFIHQSNLGYGGNQKTCYNEALKTNADIVIMLHPDLSIPSEPDPVYGEYDRLERIRCRVRVTNSWCWSASERHAFIQICGQPAAHLVSKPHSRIKNSPNISLATVPSHGEF